jgi:hypothetical protein
MPLLAVNVSDRLFVDIKELVEKGKYQSPESFLEIAAFNQLALERGASPAELIQKGHRTIRATDPVHASNGHERRAENQKAATRATSTRREAKPIAKTDPVTNDSVSAEEIDAAIKRLSVAQRDLKSPQPQPAKPHGSEARIWGQVNRLFSLKLACRWLSTAATTEGNWPKYEAISDRLADDAAIVGTLLEQADTVANRKRDELLATGLPRRGNSASRDRFLSQFLARITRAGDIFPGAIWQYELATFDDSVISLTDQGQAFADLKNPLLDGDLKASAALDPAESQFLADQIQKFVPVERDDMRVILSAVFEGKVTPADLFAAVSSKFPSAWSEVMAHTHVSGLVARLSDLRLLKRNWQGRKVTYELGEKDLVETFLKN